VAGLLAHHRARDLSHSRPRFGFARRLVHFWFVWSVLLLVHEAGHALLARWQGLPVRRVTVGVGPPLWRGHRGDTEVVLRLVPVLGVTDVAPGGASTGRRVERGSVGRWASESATLAGGIAATIVAAVLASAVVLARERATRRRFVWGRYVVADAVVLTAFNFLPVPPLDGGRALLAAVAALRGAPLAPEAMFWIKLGGLAMALLPMLMWTRWTAPIDAVSLHWGAPRPAVPQPTR
jgi:membrane-associated protease RseP (regulator of RpoE activity)